MDRLVMRAGLVRVLTEKCGEISSDMDCIPTIDEMLRRYEGWKGLTPDQIRDYGASLNAHIRYVREAGRRLGVSEEQLKAHDLSKWSDAEFPYYARQFCAGGSPVDADHQPNDFARAWLHHIHRNPHHWQHWLFPDGYAPAGSGVVAGAVEMPRAYVLEMVADWMGASKTYTGSWDMSDWLVENMPKIRLHPHTGEYVRGVLAAHGYAEVVFDTKFAHEGDRERTKGR